MVLGVTVDEVLNGEKQVKKSAKKIVITKKMIGGGMCFCFAILGIIMQTIYFTLGTEYRMEYIIDSLVYVVNGIIIVLAFLGVLILTGRKSKLGKGCAVILGIIFLINIAFALINDNENKQTIIDLSPRFKKMLILKYDKDNGKVYYYRNQILWFARPHSIFPYTVENDVKTQWLADDICAITYQSPDDGKVHQFVATYGDRGNGITTPYVYNLITGEWMGSENSTAGWSIKTGMNGITVSDGGSVLEEYTFDDCVQFGSLALALCENGLPIWTVSLNEDCEIGENGYLNSGGTISLCRVSMNKTSPIKLGRASSVPDYSTEVEVIKTNEEYGKDLVRRMRRILKADPDLSEYEQNSECVKVICNEEEDIFEIIRRATWERHNQLAVNGVDCDVQIRSIEILAGGDYDCLVEVYSTETADSGQDSETVDFQTQYRVMKGENAYLIERVSYGVDGYYGLEKAGVKQKKYFEENEEYHYFVPGVK